jgi:hypothetical protein
MREIVGFSEELPCDPDQGDPACGDGRTQEHELHRRQARLSHFFPVLRIPILVSGAGAFLTPRWIRDPGWVKSQDPDPG